MKTQAYFLGRASVEYLACDRTGFGSLGLSQSVSDGLSIFPRLVNADQNAFTGRGFGPKTEIISKRIKLNLSVRIQKDSAVTEHQGHRQSSMFGYIVDALK